MREAITGKLAALAEPCRRYLARVTAAGWCRVALAWLVASLLCVWAFERVQTEVLLEMIKRIRWPEFALAAALLPLQVAIVARRWQVVNAGFGMTLTYGQAFRAYYLSTLINQLIPGGVVGDVVRVTQHARQHKSAAQAWYVALLDRAFGLLALAFVALASFALWPLCLGIKPPWPLLVAMVALFAGALALCMIPVYRLLPRRGPMALRMFRKRWLVVYARAQRKKPASGRGSHAFVLSLLLVGTCMLQLGLCSAALPKLTPGVGILFKAWLVYPVVLAAMAMPLSLGGLGVREASAVVVLPWIGFDQAGAVALALLSGLAVFVGTLPALVLLPRMRVPLAPPSEVKDERWALWAGIASAVVIHLLLLGPRVLSHIERFSTIQRINGSFTWATYESWLARTGEDFWRISGEVTVALLALMLVQRGASKTRKLVRALAIFAVLATFVYELNVLVGTLLMNQEPLIYDEIFLAAHCWVLLSDLWNPTVALGGVVAAVAVLGAGWCLVRLVEAVERGLPAADRKVVLLGGLVLTMLASSFLNPKWNEREAQVQWTSAGLARNLMLSWSMWTTIDQTIANAKAQATALPTATRRPSIVLYVVESYGKIMADHAPLAQPWQARLADARPTLDRAGWHMASGYSIAPVSGGRSWLADGSVFLGQTIRYEAEFRHYLRHLSDMPHLVDYLRDNGYDTLRLAPADRTRPGIVTTNDWGFDKMVTFDELDYRGPHLGWGLVPDQWSLGYLNDVLMPTLRSPSFAYFHMVTAHAPWHPLPPVLSDWRDVVTHADPDSLTNESAQATVMQAAWRFRRTTDSRYAYAGALTDQRTQAYANAIDYDLQILFEQLARTEKGDLVIVMGDHQPPLMADYTTDFAVPVHVFARDRALLAAFFRRGFADGLLPNAAVPAILHRDFLAIMLETLHP